MAKIKEKVGKIVFTVMAIICVIVVVSIFIFLMAKSIPVFRKIGITEFIFGNKWSPNRMDTYASELKGSYGIFTMIIGTIYATIGALTIGGTLGYFTSVFLVFYCPKYLKKPFSTVINLLAGIPSVIYGFFGLAFLLPLVSNIAPNNGSGLLSTSIILGIMIMPTVVALSRNSLESVPKMYYEGSLAMGVNHTTTVFKVMVPSSSRGILASLGLGICRALGETMAVIMVAGNSPTLPKGLFNSFRVMTANIVLEMGYAGEVQEDALIATGAILLLFVLIINLIIGHLSQKGSKSVDKIKENTKASTRVKEFFGRLNSIIQFPRLGKGASILSGAMSVVTLTLIIGFIFIKGIPTLITTEGFVFGKYEFGSEKISIFSAIVCTLMVVVISLLISVPIGVMTAIYLNEYAKKSNRITKIVKGSISTLGGVPSIVYGLFGMITFVRLLGGHASILSGSLTIAIMLLPTIVRSTEESLKNVQISLREASLALGAGKLRTILKIVLPSAMSGILTAIILSIGRVVSESAPLLYTMGSIIKSVPKSIFDSGATLSVALYQLSGEGWHIDEAYATAVVLILLVLGLNLTTELIGKYLEGDKNESKKQKSNRAYSGAKHRRKGS